MKKGGSGIYSNREHKDAFDFFVENSTFEYLNKGSNGLTIVGNLNEGIVSPYQHLSDDKFQTPVNKLLIKLVAINVTENIKIYIDRYNGLYIRTCISSSFEKDANSQINLYKNTSDYFSPLCPAIVYYDVYNGTAKNDFIDSLEFENENRKDKRIIQTLKDSLTEEDCKLGIIGIEFAEGYVTMYDEIRKWKYIKEKSSASNKESNKIIKFLWVNCAYVILEMALKTGYSHGDFHISNIMVLHDKDNFFVNPLLIDFGLVHKIDRSIMEQIRHHVDEHK
jgi:hypothetical protein